MDTVLSLKNVTKSYENHIAVNDVSFDVPKGSIFGLLGPNGAGKTSLIRIVTTITKADRGIVELNGSSIDSNRPAQIGYMPEERGLYKKMKVGEQLMYLARLKGMSKTDAKAAITHWLEKFEIESWWNKKIDELSKGMQQKIQFIATVVHNPPLLILDEPFSGLDPINTNLIKQEIDNIRDTGTSIIFSTHRMEQVEEICEHIVLINNGKNVLEGKVDEVKATFKENLFKVEFKGALGSEVLNTFNVVDKKEHSVKVKLNEAESSNAVLQKFIQSGTQVVSFNEILPTLNEIFIKCVGDYNANQ